MIRRAAVCAVIVGAAVPAHAGGPLIVNGAGQPVTWTANPIRYNPDRGTLGALTNAQATARLATSAAVWTNVASSSVTLSAGSQLPVDVTVANYIDYLSTCGDNLSPIIFDTDGSITDDLLGEGANNSVLGFAAPACGTYVPPVIQEGYSVMNGRFLDGVDNAGNPEISAQEFEAVLTHELGHYIGLDHSQVNLDEARDADPGNDDAIATMFPILINASEMTSLNLDDTVAVSALYPGPTFSADFGTISGSIFLSDGTTPFQGANVIARETSDPRFTAVSQVSGARFFPSLDGGPPDPALRGHYELVGLPLGSYTIEIEPIYQGFTGGSSVGPLNPPAGLPGPPDFWNGVDEAGSNPPDDPAIAYTILISPGTNVSGVDISINQGPPPANDDCSAAVDITSTPFVDEIDTTGATLGAFDPLQSCTFFPGGSQNEKSVWYRFTAPVDGVVQIETDGSSYDTVVSASTGACGALSEAGCDDDSGPGRASDLRFVADGGVSYLIEVTSFDAGGGTLELALDFTPLASCAPAPRNDCRAPVSPDRASLSLRRGSDPAKYRLKWKWGTGDASTDELGDPFVETGTSYALCLYDGSGTRALTARAPAADRCGLGDRDCWRHRSIGLGYKDRALLPDGLASMGLRSDAGSNAKFSAKGSGSNLDMPMLPLDFPVVVQLLNSDGHCWENQFPASGIQKNDGVDLKAKGE